MTSEARHYNFDLQPLKQQGLLRRINIFIFILLIPLTSALQFSPTSLEFNLEKNQVSCKEINFQIESTATIHDSWAEDSSDSWSISNFQTSPQELQLNINYPQQISTNEKTIQVCASGSKPGDYKGALIFRQGEVGNSIVEFAVWLKVNIEGEEQSEEETPDSKKSKSSNHGGSSSNILWTSESATKQLSKKTQSLSFEIPEEEIELNKKIPKEEIPAQIIPMLLIALPAILIILLILALTQR